ncbi:di-heme-cytochrome C peroxidase [Marinobacterium jannaschii]|uniref:di-heme-cytochrome C peroxidase n=1 Tax=Marinobacterium jannaschii TaxID=64970 RepID=UPI0004873DEC|nr:di-heme-cytochrome C peroxidase [Marinobacterium jannaschii]
MTKIIPLAAAVTAASALLAGCSAFNSDNENHSHITDIARIQPAGAIPQRVGLDQGWNDETRWNFWFTSQGARIIPYNWFTWLEQADSTELFRSTDHMESLRYLPVASAASNPAGLPIGFALDEDDKTGEAWVGLTCAACHTNQIDYNGTKMLIEGAPTLGNFVLFFSQLVDALNATNMDDAKFERFARNVLGNEYDPERASDLRQNLGEIALASAERRMVNDLPAGYDSDFTSYARLDAFGNIQNAGSAFALHDLNNRNTPNAPVSYPFLWGTHQSDVVQWNASAPNTPVVGPLVRNIGEVVGVFGGLSIEEAPFWQRLWGKQTRYSSSVDMIGLGHLESWVKTLRSPAWPQQYLPVVDAVKAAEGAALYQQQCASCHQVIPRAKEGEKYIAVKTPVAEVGTDPATAWNAVYHQAKSLVLEGEKSKIIAGSKFESTTDAISIPVNGVIGMVLKEPGKALKAGLMPMRAGEKGNKTLKNPAEDKSLEQHLKDHIEARQQLIAGEVASSGAAGNKINGLDLTGLVYKARPLNGIWATAPFLHNGSVPSLWQLLQKPEQRVTEFWVGSRELDPVNVGFVTAEGLSEFRVTDDTGRIQPGNSNRGHRYGTDLSDAQKWALVEYMKTL